MNKFNEWVQLATSKNLTSNEKIVLMVILNKYNMGWDSFSQSIIAEESNLSLSTTKRILKELKLKGALKFHQSEFKSSYNYTLCPVPQLDMIKTWCQNEPMIKTWCQNEPMINKHSVKMNQNIVSNWTDDFEKHSVNLTHNIIDINNKRDNKLNSHVNDEVEINDNVENVNITDYETAMSGTPLDEALNFINGLCENETTAITTTDGNDNSNCRCSKTASEYIAMFIEMKQIGNFDGISTLATEVEQWLIDYPTAGTPKQRSALSKWVENGKAKEQRNNNGKQTQQSNTTATTTATNNGNETMKYLKRVTDIVNDWSNWVKSISTDNETRQREWNDFIDMFNDTANNPYTVSKCLDNLYTLLVNGSGNRPMLLTQTMRIAYQFGQSHPQFADNITKRLERIANMAHRINADTVVDYTQPI